MIIPPALKSANNLTVLLPSGKKVLLPQYRIAFKKWTDELPEFDFGNKPFVNYENQVVFAELAVLKIFTSSGWDGAWVETYGGKNFLQSMPSAWKLSQYNIPIPKDKEALLEKIWKIGKTTACFDVFVWKDDNILFCEAKHKNKDKLTNAQLKFIEGALACGIKEESFFIIEWEYE